MGVKVGEGGKLYGSITAKDIADALARRGITVDRHKVDLPEPLKSLGTYKVAVKVFAGHDARSHHRRGAEGLLKREGRAVRPLLSPQAWQAPIHCP
jgi:CBS domain-containing protein